MRGLRCLAGIAILMLGKALHACPPLEVGLLQQEPDIWVRPGRALDPAGWTEPVVVWVGPAQIWVGDPGPHRCAGLALRRELQKRWPGRTHQLINSHAHPRNVLANSAWPQGTPIHSLARVQREMATRCPGCVQSLRDELGPDWMHGTRIVLPNRIWRPGQWVNMGLSRWQIEAAEPAHTEADLLLKQPQRRLWWAPSVVGWQEVPDLTRADLAEWKHLVQRAQAVAAWKMLGASSQRAALGLLDRTDAYLTAIDVMLIQAQRDGRYQHELYAWFDGLPTPAPGQQGLRQHQLNVQKVWRDLEDKADFSNRPRSP